MHLNLTDKIKKAVVTAKPQSWPTYDGGSLTRDRFVTASEANSCIRLLAFQKLEERNTKPVANYWSQFTEEELQIIIDDVGPDHRFGVFARGHNVEAWVVETLLNAEQDDEVFMHMGQEQVSFYSERFRVSGTPDGLYFNNTSNELVLIEIKSSQNQITQPRSAHIVQTQVNMGLIQALRDEGGKVDDLLGLDDLPEVITGAKLFYVHSDNYMNMQEFDIPYDDGAAFVRAKSKAKKLFGVHGDGKLTPPEHLEPEGLKNRGGCFFCQFKERCKNIEDHRKDAANSKKLRDIIDNTFGKEPPQMPKFNADTQKAEICKVLAQYDNFATQEKWAKAQKEGLKGAITDWVRDQQGMKVAFEDDGKLFKAALSVSSRAGSIDQDALAKALQRIKAEVDDFRKASSTVESLRVSVKKLA